MERLDKLIANTGRFSRREVKELVKQGRVLVDGVPVKAADSKVEEATVVITVDGQPIGRTGFTYLLLHKTSGVLTATEDRTQETVLDLIRPEDRRRDLSPVGRLDKDTEGLLLLTDDGELNHRLTSPRHHVEKIYYAEVEGTLERSDAERFAAGIELKDFTCRSAGLEILTDHTCLVTVREGKFHQVRRMLASCGKPVTYLKRLQMGPLQLGALPRGGYRTLSSEEIAVLRGCVQL